MLQQPLYTGPLLTLGSCCCPHCLGGRYSGRELLLTLHTLRSFIAHPQKGSATLALITIPPILWLTHTGLGPLSGADHGDCIGRRRRRHNVPCSGSQASTKAASLSPLWQLKRLALTYSQKKIVTVVVKVSTTRKKPRISPSYSVL